MDESREKLLQLNFDKWWHEIGSGIIPKSTEDLEEFSKKVAFAAFKSRQQLNDESVVKLNVWKTETDYDIDLWFDGLSIVTVVGLFEKLKLSLLNRLNDENKTGLN